MDFDEHHVPEAEPDEPDPMFLTRRRNGNQEAHPVNWEDLGSNDAEAEWLELNAWVNMLRRIFALPATVVPPFWHRHPEFVWELSALHQHWLGAYARGQHGSAPIGWMQDFAAAQMRLRGWAAAAGTKLDRDRPTRQTVWPGEDPLPETGEVLIENRDLDFVQFVNDDVARRRAEEDEFYRSIADRDPHRD